MKDEFWCEYLNEPDENCKHDQEQKSCPLKCCPFLKPDHACPSTQGNR